ncbi:MAG TPA: glycoside hydrolase family protein [Tepidisphaeraceae bacterium]|jgi:hypothetical protein
MADSSDRASSAVLVLPAPPAPAGEAFALDDQWVWDNAVIRADDGRYHLFTTRWPKTTPYSPYWLYRMEIIRAVADRPEGPYHLAQACFPERVRDKWDGMACHNPAIVRWRGTYYLFYRGQTFDGPVPGPDHPEPDLSQRFWDDWSRKSIGVATSNSIEGPWTRTLAPVLAPRPGEWDAHCCSNPAPVILPDGTTYLLYKTRTRQTEGPMLLGVARAPHPLGPYERLGDGPIISGTSADRSFEDPFLWHDGRRFHLLCKDMNGHTCGEPHGGVHATSDDAVQWETAEPKLAYSRRVRQADGTEVMLGSFERPWLLIDDAGRPTHLFGSAADGPGGFWNASRTWIAVVPLE